jgi:hypothetical protein
MRQYTTIAKVEAYLLIDIAEDFKDNVTRWIESVSKHIETYTGRVFIADAEDEESVRRFDGTGTDTVVIDDAVEITELSTVVDGFEDAIDADDFVAYPANALPVTKLKLIGAVFPRYPQSVRVEARWGYSDTVPEDIEHAATVLIAGIINESNQHDGEVASETIGKYSVSYNTEQQKHDFDMAKSTLDLYRRIRF